MGYVNDEAEVSSGVESSAARILKKKPSDLSGTYLDGRGNLVDLARLDPKHIVTLPKAQDVRLTIDARLQYVAERELAAGLAKSHGGNGRVIAVFQPHRYSRLQALWDEFLTCFVDADLLYLTDVYAAHEPVIPGMTADAFAQKVSHSNARYVPLTPDFDRLRAELKAVVQPGDVVLSMGAGNITKLLRNWQDS